MIMLQSDSNKPEALHTCMRVRVRGCAVEDFIITHIQILPQLPQLFFFFAPEKMALEEAVKPEASRLVSYLPQNKRSTEPLTCVLLKLNPV